MAASHSCEVEIFCFESSAERLQEMLSVMSTICIPLMFPQKTKASKPHNALEDHRQSSSSLGCSCSAPQLGGSLRHSGSVGCVLLAPEAGQLQLLPAGHPPGRGRKAKEKRQTNHELPNTSSRKPSSLSSIGGHLHKANTVPQGLLTET